jgi:hypothetical protein
MEWLNAGIAPLKDLIAFLHSKTRTNDIQKKQLIIELRDNLNVFKNGFLNEVSNDRIIDLLSNDAIHHAIKQNFPFKRLKAGIIPEKLIYDERNKKYKGWSTDRLVDKIDEKLVELKNIKKMNNGSVLEVKNNISLMMSNLYYRMKLLADFIRS